MNGPMNASAASQKTRRKFHRKVFERIKESKCESNILETSVIAK